MLPSSSTQPYRGHLHTPLLPEYIRRFFSFRQMDFGWASAQLVELLLRPSDVPKTARMRKQIKNSWARDDPAFNVLVMAGILITTLAYSLAFRVSNIVHLLRLTIGGLFIEFGLVGILIAWAIRSYVNAHMRIQRLHAAEQSVEWLYAWDVHVNALAASFLLVAIGQYALLPLITSQHTLIATASANTLWLAGAAYYAYITFLGYSALPFIDRPERLFYPMGILCLLYLLLLLINFNVSSFVLDMYFGHTHEAETLEGGIVSVGGVKLDESMINTPDATR